MPSRPPLRVLIADDSPRLRRLLADAVGEVAGVEVVAEVEDGAAALAGVRTHRPDVVVLDLHMPIVGGLVALRALRESGARLAGARPQVIVLTNHTGDVYRDACLAEGADHFFDKSAEVDRVLGVLRALAAADVAETSALAPVNDVAVAS